MTNSIDKSGLFKLAWRNAKAAGSDARKAFGAALRQAWAVAKRGMLAFELAVVPLVADTDLSGVKLGRWNGYAYQFGGRRRTSYASMGGSYGGGVYRE